MAESATITGLQPGTTYHYRIVAKNVEGTVERLGRLRKKAPLRLGYGHAVEADEFSMIHFVLGARAGRRAGMNVLGCAPDGEGQRLAGEGSITFASMARLPALLGLA